MVDRLFTLTFGRGILGILIVNVSGSFLLGIVSAIILEQDKWPSELKLFTSIGILGSYTTFSTLAVSTTQFAESGDITRAALNILGSVVIGVAAAFAGLAVGRAI